MWNFFIFLDFLFLIPKSNASHTGKTIYNKESAINLKNDLKLKLNNKKIYIIKSGDNKYKLLSGTYNSVNLLKNDYIVLKKYGFEDLDIKLND